MSGGVEPLLGALKDFRMSANPAMSGASQAGSTTYVDIPGLLDLTVGAAVGDLIVVDGMVSMGTENTRFYVDAGTYAGTTYTSFRTDVDGCLHINRTDWTRMPFRDRRVLVAGDIVGGQATVRLRYKTEGAAKTFGITHWGVFNYGAAGGWAALDAIPYQTAAPTNPSVGDLWLDSDEPTPDAAWQSWTPTWTNLTVGNGTLIARYTQSGKTVCVALKLTLGSTSSVGSAVVALTLPVAAAHANHVFGTAYNDFGSQIHSGATYPSSTTVAGLTLGTGWVATTAPFTWTTNDEIVVSGTYEAA